jgi:cytochrome c
LRWLLVIVPAVILAAAGSYLLGLRPAAVRDPAHEERIGPPDRPAPGESDRGERPFAERAPPAAQREGFEVAAVLALLPHADPRDGERVFKMCAPCHSAERGAPNGVGTTLWGIVGQRKAARPDFNYSLALRTKGGTWTYEELAAYLHSPRAFAPGTSMAFVGIVDNHRMANLLAYLRSLSDMPVPLPK